MRASIPGAPPPPPGFPTLPVPPPAPVPFLPREELPLLEPGANDGIGAPVLEPAVEPLPVPPFEDPAGAEVPPTGPVAKVFPVGAFAGLGMLNGVDGFATGAGDEVGFALGLAVGGAGFAGEGLFAVAG